MERIYRYYDREKSVILTLERSEGEGPGHLRPFAIQRSFAPLRMTCLFGMHSTYTRSQFAPIVAGSRLTGVFPRSYNSERLSVLPVVVFPVDAGARFAVPDRNSGPHPASKSRSFAIDSPPTWRNSE